MRLLLLLFLLSATAAQAAWERIGQTSSGAVYRMAVPESWRSGDGLVVYQHDLRYERDLDPELGPLALVQLAQGYAVAASGYSQAGWAVFASGDDNRELVERFRQDVGEPGQILSYGAGMGGYVALQMAEDPHLRLDGALALCPHAAGYRGWDAALDLRVQYDAICAGVDGGELPSAGDRSWLLPSGAIDPAGLADVIARGNRCLGLDRAAADRSADQQARLLRLQAQTGIDDESNLLLSLSEATLGLSDLLRDPGKLAGRVGLGNVGVDYGDALLDRAVQRIEADPFAALDFRRRAGLAGGGTARVLSLHDRGQPLAALHRGWLQAHLPVQRWYASEIAGGGSTGCALQAAELRAAWDGLRSWLAEDRVPDAIELQARCLALLDGDDASGTCRIETATTLVAPELPRPRNPPLSTLDARFSGHWYDPARDGEGWLVELLDSGSALVYGFTYPDRGSADAQLWLFGSGEVSENGIAVDQVFSLRGGEFGTGYRSTQTRWRRWGELQLVFEQCGRARIRFQGPDGYGRDERVLQQLQTLAGLDCAEPVPMQAAGLGALSGSWYDPAQPGQGLVLNVDAAGAAQLLWFGYAAGNGEPLWLVGDGGIDDQGRLRIEAAARPTGTRFDDFDASAIERTPWGDLELRFSGCDRAELRYRSSDADYGDGRLAFIRLTRPLGLGDCGLPARD